MGVEEFLSLTPRLFRALTDQHELLLKRQDSMTELMVAQLVAMVANTGFRNFKDQRQPKEFMPSAWAEKSDQPQPVKRLTKAARKKIVDETRAIMRRARLGKLA